jgi:hypothetical protein
VEVSYLRFFFLDHFYQFAIHGGIPNRCPGQSHGIHGPNPIIVDSVLDNLISSRLEQLPFSLENLVLTSGLLVKIVDD